MKKVVIKFLVSQFIIFILLGLVSCGVPENIVGFQFSDKEENLYQIVTDDVLYSQKENIFRYYDYIKGENKKDSFVSISWLEEFPLNKIKLTEISEVEKEDLKNKLEKVPDSLSGYIFTNENGEFQVINNQYLVNPDGFYCTYIYNTMTDCINGKIKVLLTPSDYKEYCLFDAIVVKMDENKRAQLEKEMYQDFTYYEILNAEKKEFVGSNESFRELSFNNKKRMNGNDVAILQYALYSLGYTEVGEIDGWFGPNTDKALKNFQKDYGFEENGIFSEKCFEVMIKTLYSKEIESGSLDTYRKTKETKYEEWFDNAEIQLSSMFYGSTKKIKNLFSDFPKCVSMTKEIGKNQAKIHLKVQVKDMLIGELDCVFSYPQLSSAGSCTLTEVTLKSMGDVSHSKVYTDIYKEPENAGECFGIMYMALMTFSMFD